jgi:DNA mismatch repair protein MutL
MDKTIQVLSEVTINQIAAGEVIENPASVIKELFENACDARARRIEIEVQGGGFVLLQVSDDGSGMGPDDARACLQRHATSKIRAAEDLFLLRTMGFRGEALASIAAVSKLQITTALEGCEGIALSVEGGRIVDQRPSWRAQGTCMEVRSLFYTVPARKKFQKSQTASSAEITKMVTVLALAHPEVGVRLTAQNREIFCLPPATLETRSNALLGSSFEKTHALACGDKGWSVQGLLVGPQETRMNRSGQYLFVNQRPVVCPPLSFAVRDGYGTRLSMDRHPLFVLHVTIDPALIDVNVHPQKKEIRLRDETHLKQGLRTAVAAALGQRSVVVPAVDLPDFAPSSFSHYEAPAFPLRMEERSFRKDEPRAIGLYDKWLLIDAAERILFVDLPAAQAYLFTEHMHSDPVLQAVLVPYTFSCAKAEAHYLMQKLEALRLCGVQMRAAGEAAFIIDALHPQLDEDDMSRIVQALLDEEMPLQAICRAVRRRKRVYALHEAMQLFKQLLKTGDLCYFLEKAIIYPLSKDVIPTQEACETHARDGRR